MNRPAYHEADKCLKVWHLRMGSIELLCPHTRELKSSFGDDIEAEHVNHMADILLVAQTHGIRLDDAQRRIHRKQSTRDSHHLDRVYFDSYRRETGGLFRLGYA